ncbi:UNVERIFIED_CONTAM: hypothetical protein K2H54_066201 [Gekko kuhli]
MGMCRILFAQFNAALCWSRGASSASVLPGGFIMTQFQATNLLISKASACVYIFRISSFQGKIMDRDYVFKTTVILRVTSVSPGQMPIDNICQPRKKKISAYNRNTYVPDIPPVPNEWQAIPQTIVCCQELSAFLYVFC